jgi:hypothetical protein
MLSSVTDAQRRRREKIGGHNGQRGPHAGGTETPAATRGRAPATRRLGESWLNGNPRRNMNSNVRDIAERNARRVTYLGRVLFIGDCGFRGLADLRNLSTTGCQVMSEISLQLGMDFSFR